MVTSRTRHVSAGMTGWFNGYDEHGGGAIDWARKDENCKKLKYFLFFTFFLFF